MTEPALDDFDATFEMDRDSISTGDLAVLVAPARTDTPRIRPVRFGIRMLLLALVLYFVVGLLPDLLNAADELTRLDPLLIALGFGLQLLALFFYSMLTKAALGDAGHHLSATRMFRIQLSTRSLTNVVPGGNAAGSALGYRLLTLSGVKGPDAGFALATAGIGSAVVLNLVFWIGLIVSIPRRGVNPYYGAAALAGIIVIGVAVALGIGIMEGQKRAERVARWVAGVVRSDPDKMAAAIRQIGVRLDELVSDRVLLKKVVTFALLNWLVDAASLWVFLRAFGGSLEIDALIVSFGLANLLAAVPITPGGLGYVDLAYLSTLVGFGLSSSNARLGIASYRLAQFFFPILVGGLSYLSLRVGPWRIEKRDRLARLRELARTGSRSSESRLDFALRFGRRPVAESSSGDRDGVAATDARSDGPGHVPTEVEESSAGTRSPE